MKLTSVGFTCILITIDLKTHNPLEKRWFRRKNEKAPDPPQSLSLHVTRYLLDWSGDATAAATTALTIRVERAVRKAQLISRVPEDET